MTFQEIMNALGIEQIFNLSRCLSHALKGFTYRFLDEDEFKTIFLSDVREANRIYWYEILERAHLAAVTGLLRQHRWLEATVASACSSNFLAFAACLRGFVESTADIWDGLNGVATTLGRDFLQIRSALARQYANSVLVSKELEDRLIHFQFARKIQKGESSIPVHQAKSVKEYLDKLEPDCTGHLHDCYSKLCAVTHPGAHSVLWFTLGSADATSSVYTLNDTPDEQAIRALSDEFAKLPPYMVQQGFNLPFLTLKTLNEFDVPELHTVILDSFNLDNIPAWQRIREQISHTK